MPTTNELLNEARCLGCASNASESELIMIALLQRISEAETADSSAPLVYRALFNQTGVNAPVVTVLENTLSGAIVWARTGVGNYTGTLAGAFPTGKTYLAKDETWQDIDAQSTSNNTMIHFVRTSDNVVSVQVGDFGAAGEYSDAIAITYIEILVYP